MPNISICIDCRLMFYRTAGISYYTRRLVQALAQVCQAPSAPQLPCSISLLIDRRDSDTAWVPANVRIIRTFTPAHHRLERFALPIELAARQIFNFQFSILHSPDFITTRGRFKKVITVHDLYFMDHPEVMTADASRYYDRTRWSAQHADRVIAVSNFTRDDIARHMHDVVHKVHVVHEAADPEVAGGESRGERDAFRPSPATLSFPFFLFVGTLEPRKNLATLLRAMKRLPLEVKLVIAGADGWGETDIGALASEPGLRDRVTLAGRVGDAELDALYRNARALVIPSLSEGFGLPVLEAMSRGTPVICSDSGALPEIAGQAALVQAPMDDEQLARNLLAVWHDDGLHAELSRRGRTHVSQFSWERAAEETLMVYWKVLGESRSN